MKRSVRRLRQNGLSLVELSLALVILGITLLIVWQFIENHKNQKNSQQSSLLLDRAQTTLTMYAALNGRLPCPAKNMNGLEFCDHTKSGYLPYLTLGLPEVLAGSLLYEVPSETPGLTGGPLFTALMPSMVDFPDNVVVKATSLSPLAIATSNYDHVMDLCAALAGKGLSISSAKILVNEGQAYSLAAVDMGARGVKNAKVEDQENRRWVSRGQLGGQLRCAGLQATAGRGHFNARLSSVTMARTLYDYQTQSDIAHGNDTWTMASTSWWLSNSLFGVGKATRVVWLAHSKALTDRKPEDIAQFPWKVASLATITAGAVYQASQLSIQIKALVESKSNHDKLDMLVARSQALDTEIQRNAVFNSSSFFFLAEQNHRPLPQVLALKALPGLYYNGGELGEKARRAVP